MVGRTVVLELGCVMRGCCGLAQAEVGSVLRHLLGLYGAPKMGDNAFDEDHCEEQLAEILGAAGVC